VHHPLVAQPKPVVVQKTDPTLYLDVAQADTEAPKQAKYYSDKNSRAANPDAAIESNQPKLNGHQRDVPKTEDAPRPMKAKTATPAPPEKETVAQPAEPKPTGLSPGALQPGKPADQSNPDNQTQPRPRTLSAARAQQEKLPGLQMQQEGGVRQHKLQASLDAIATSNGEYDSAIIRAVTQRWYDLLETQHFAYNRFGKSGGLLPPPSGRHHHRGENHPGQRRRDLELCLSGRHPRCRALCSLAGRHAADDRDKFPGNHLHVLLHCGLD